MKTIYAIALLLVVFGVSYGTYRYKEFVKADMVSEISRIESQKKNRNRKPKLIRIGPHRCVPCHRWGR